MPTTFDEVWFEDRSLLRFADEKDRADILAGYRNAVRSDELLWVARQRRIAADDYEREARSLVDHRVEVLARLKARAAQGGAS